VVLVQVAGGLILVVLLGAAILRGRRTRSSAASRRDVRPTLPPSPYTPSRGFRIVDGSEPAEHHEVRRPRIDPVADRVFGESVSGPGDALSPPHLRHDEQWALDRSMRRVAPPRIRRRRRVMVALVIAVLVAAVGVATWWGLQPSTHHAGLGLNGLELMASGAISLTR